MVSIPESTPVLQGLIVPTAALATAVAYPIPPGTLLPPWVPLAKAYTVQVIQGYRIPPIPDTIPSTTGFSPEIHNLDCSTSAPLSETRTTATTVSQVVFAVFFGNSVFEFAKIAIIVATPYLKNSTIGQWVDQNIINRIPEKEDEALSLKLEVFPEITGYSQVKSKENPQSKFKNITQYLRKVGG